MEGATDSSSNVADNSADKYGDNKDANSRQVSRLISSSASSEACYADSGGLAKLGGVEYYQESDQWISPSHSGGCFENTCNQIPSKECTGKIPCRTPTVKREKSCSDVSERIQKRVKFNPHCDSDDVIVDTHIIERQDAAAVRPTHSRADCMFQKVKKLLKTSKPAVSNKESFDNKRLDASIEEPLSYSVHADSDIFSRVTLEDETNKFSESNILATEGTDSNFPNCLTDRDSVKSSSCPENEKAPPDIQSLTEDRFLLAKEQSQEVLENGEELNLSLHINKGKGPTEELPVQVVKREGTFTLDNPPAKIMKSSPAVVKSESKSSAESEKTNASVLSQHQTKTEKSSKKVNDIVDIHYEDSVVNGKSCQNRSAAFPRCHSDSENQFHCLPNDLYHLKTRNSVSFFISTDKNTDTNQPQPSKACVCPTILKLKYNADKANSKCLAGGKAKISSLADSSVKHPTHTSLIKSNRVTKESPVKTFVSTWRKAITSSENRCKNQPSSKVAPVRKPSTSPELQAGLREITYNHCEEAKGTSKETLETITANAAKKTQITLTGKNAPSGTEMTMPAMKRDGTFTKSQSKRCKKTVQDWDHLESGLQKVSGEKDRLDAELAEVKSRLENEISNRRALRREFEAKLRQQKDEDARRSDLLMAGQRNRLEDEKRSALEVLKGSIAKVHEVELLKMARQKEDEIKKLHQDLRVMEDRLQSMMRKEALRCDEPAKLSNQLDREIERTVREVAVLREQKKNLQEIIQEQQASERERAWEVKKLHEQHEMEIAKLLKVNKFEASRLLDELRAKERIIGQLEKKISDQCAKIRYHEEQQREAVECKRIETSLKQLIQGKDPKNSKNKRKVRTNLQPRRRGLSSSSVDDASTCSDGTSPEKEPGLPPHEPSAQVDNCSLTRYQRTDPVDGIKFEEMVSVGVQTEACMDSKTEEESQSNEQCKSVTDSSINRVECVLAGDVEASAVVEGTCGTVRETSRAGENMRGLSESLEVTSLKKQIQLQGEQIQLLSELLEKKGDEKLADQGKIKPDMSGEGDTEEEAYLLENQTEIPASRRHETWSSIRNPRRDSCLKVSELPTVLEKSSDEESSPTDTLTPTDASNSSIAQLEECSNLSTNTDIINSPEEEKSSWTELLESQIRQKQQVKLRRCLSQPHGSPTYSEMLGSFAKETWWYEARISELEAINSKLQEDLQETRDHADLLEFRILEFTEGVQMICDSEPDHAANNPSATPLHDTPSLIPVTTEDLSLPLSVDSGLDLSNDRKTRIAEGRSWLLQLTKAAGDLEGHSPPAQRLAALLDWIASLPLQHVPHTPVSSPTDKVVAMGVAEDCGVSGSDLTLLAAKLQQSLADPCNQEAALTETITKLRVLDSNLETLQTKISSLTQENKELSDALAALSEAHETRTEASGTESELVARKTPSIHSDLSDAESEGTDTSSRPGKIGSLETSSSFQESGIFDSSCDLVHTATQTPETITEDTGTLIRLSDLESLNSLGEIGEQKGVKDATDLQIAVARLSSIRAAMQERDLRKVIIQDLQESDGYLKNVLEGDKVILSKVEYDCIVSAERQLQQEIEVLRCEKEQLSSQCDSLKEQLNRNRSSGSSTEDALRGELRALREKLETTERRRQEAFEERCELEEAENDARLLMQRYESQLEAAREMEALLSASLSQEQEISRELHRRIRDLQLLDKERRTRFEALVGEKLSLENQVENLKFSCDAFAETVSFAAQGLLIAQIWKKYISSCSTAIVHYCSDGHALSPCFSKSSIPNQAVDGQTLKAYPNDAAVSECIVHSVCDVCVETVPLECVDSSVQTDMDWDWMQVQQHCLQSSSSTDTYEKELSAQRDFQKQLNEGQLMAERPCTTRVNSRSTMTEKDNLLTDREKYYLEQIESLQREKICLRKDFEVEKQDSLQHQTDLETVVEHLQESLEEANSDKCHLLFKLEEITESRDAVAASFQQRVEELTNDLKHCSKVFKVEKMAVCKEYEDKLSEAEKTHLLQKEQIHSLEKQLAIFKQELEAAGMSSTSELVVLDAEMDVAGETSVSKDIVLYESSKSFNGEELLKKIRQIVTYESLLHQKIKDYEKKESAYQQTIAEADTIMSSHVTAYTRRIEELEAFLEQKSAKIKQLETSEERLRSTLRSNSRTSDCARISDLLDRLIVTENSELKLKETVWNLERSEKELQIKLVEAEKTNQCLKAELRDQEELLQRLSGLLSENSLLSADLQKAQDIGKKICDVQQSEHFLRGRVEELELSESLLRDSLRQADVRMSQKEKKLREQIAGLEEELASFKCQFEASGLQLANAQETEFMLRKAVEDLRKQLQDAETELKESSSESFNHETQHRSEVMKLRNQIKIANEQLMGIDAINCELRERVSAYEGAGKSVASQLEERVRRHEQEVLALNLQAATREARLEELEGQLQHLTLSHAVQELDILAASPLALLHSSLSDLSAAIMSCESCRTNHSSQISDFTAQLKTLSELLEGQTNSDEDDLDKNATSASPEDSGNTDTAENLANLSTSPPNPAREGPMDDLSGDTEGKENTPSYQIRPPRRKHKKRNEDGRNQSLPQGSCTILEELEEKIRELEDAVSHKEEELRLADDEAAELHARLQVGEEALVEKTEEVEKVNSTLASLRQQLLLTIEDYERMKLSLETKHKVDVNDLAKKVEDLTLEVERLSLNGQLKDKIISTLISQIRAILRSGNMAVVINQLKKLNVSHSGVEGSDGLKPSPELASDNSPVPDFNLEVVCNILSQPCEN